VEPDTLREKQLYEALRTSDPQDSDVVFFVFATEKKASISILSSTSKAPAERKQIGEASVNLEKVLRAGRDEKEATLKVVSMDGKTAIGSMTVSVLALETLTRVNALTSTPRVSALSRSPQRAAAILGGAASTVSAQGGGETIALHVVSLTLDPKAPGFSKLDTVGVEVELIDLDDATALKTPMLPRGDGRRPLAFDFRSDVRVEPDTLREKQLYEALRTSDPQDSDVVFFVFATEKKASISILSSTSKAPAERKQIGEASVNLEKVLRAGRDEKEATLKVVSMDGKTAIGSMTVSVLAFEALTRVKGLRAPPTGRAPGTSSVGRDDEAIVVHVSTLLLEGAHLQDPGVENVSVEVEMLDLDDATALKTETLPKGDGKRPLTFGFRSEVRVEAGSAREKVLRGVLKSTNGDDADVVFFVYASGRGGKGRKELGEAVVSLRRMLDAKRDERDVTLSVASAGQRVGTLSVSVFALATLARVMG